MTSTALERRARSLSYFTVGYNFLEGLASVVTGAAAGSTALIGFGLDSFVESLSGGVMIWRFRDRGTITHEARARIERRAVRLVGITFFILGLFVLFESGVTLYSGDSPEVSAAGIVIAILSLIVMPALFFAKRRTAAQLQSRSLHADARQTLACVLLSAGLLVGLALNAVLGWWQADSVVGLLIGLALLREGYETLDSGKLCSC